MNLCRCERGLHFYDKEKNATCPFCGPGGGAGDEGDKTVAIDQSEMIGETERFDTGAFQPAFMGQGAESNLRMAQRPADMGMAQQGNGFTQPTIPVDNQFGGTVPLETGFGGTVPLETSFGGPVGGTVPMGGGMNGFPPPPPAPYEDDDDDHTVAFFDTDFFATNAAGPSRTPAAGSNRVSSPCVGWLVAMNGSHVGTDFRLKAGKNFVGRNANMDVALTDDHSVSRDKHAIVVYEPKQHLYLIQPGEASSLVYKNDEVVLTPMRLEAYDIITLGDVNLVFMPLCSKDFDWKNILQG